MAKAISVKVSRLKVIEALTNKLEEMAKQKAIYEEQQKNYEMNHEVWKSHVAQIAYANFDITKASKRSAAVVADSIGFRDQIMDALKHGLVILGLEDRIEHHFLATVPFSSPTQNIGRL